MLVTDLLIAFVVMVIIMAVLLFVSRLQGPAPRLVLVALAVFLAAWVGGLWVVPFGPTVQQAYWAPFLATGVVFALIWLAVSPWPARGGPRGVHSRSGQPYPAEDTAEVAVISGFFWLMLVALGVLIAAGYLRG